MYRILIATSDPASVQTHSSFLHAKGCSLEIITQAKDARFTISSSSYDLILTDAVLTDSSGFSLCSEIRSQADIPVIFLSRCFDDEHQLAAFSAGACDYISLDSSLDLFWARIQLRIVPSTFQPRILREFPPLTLDLQRQRAYINETNLRLTQIEFALLALLSSRPKVIWSVDELYTEIWGTTSSPDPQIVQAHLSRMRRKIEKAYPRHDFIETVWRKGYQFVPLPTSFHA